MIGGKRGGGGMLVTMFLGICSVCKSERVGRMDDEDAYLGVGMIPLSKCKILLDAVMMLFTCYLD